MSSSPSNRSRPPVPPKLAELIAYCQEHGIKGSYKVRKQVQWIATIRVNGEVRYGPHNTPEAALDRIAGAVLDSLRDPRPTPGTHAFPEWQERQKRAREAELREKG